MQISKGREREMGIKIVLLIVFFAVMVGVGIYSRRHAASVDGSFWEGALPVRGSPHLPMAHLISLLSSS